MSFLKRLVDVMSGKIARSNTLIGNHGVRISDKVKNDSSLLGIIVRSTAYCTTDFLVNLLFESLMEDFKYDNGDIELNPFKEFMNNLDRFRSYEMFKLVAGNLLAGIFANGLLSDDDVRINIPELRNQFFDIYEYNDEDKEIFFELLKLGNDGGHPTPETRVYDYIFERAYKIDPPNYVSQMINFNFILKGLFSQIFIPGVIKLMPSEEKKA